MSSAPYEGAVEGEEWRDGLILVTQEDAPDDHNFPKVSKRFCPPETFYAFDPVTGRTECMVSYDAYGVAIGWDMDRSGRYFTRVGRPLQCPRYVEFCYDASAALKAGEVWGHSHPNYKGSMNALTSSLNDHRVAPRSKHTFRQPVAPTGGKTPPVRGGMPTGPVRKASAPVSAPPKRSLRKPVPTEPVDESLMTDRSKMDAKARDTAADLASQFGDSGKPKPAKKLVRRKRA